MRHSCYEELASVVVTHSKNSNCIYVIKTKLPVEVSTNVASSPAAKRSLTCVGVVTSCLSKALNTLLVRKAAPTL